MVTYSLPLGAKKLPLGTILLASCTATECIFCFVSCYRTGRLG